MAFSTLVDLVKVTSSSTGQGALVLGAAVAGFLTPDTVIPPITSGTVVSYGITDTTGNEVGQGTLTQSGSFWTLTRGVTQSSNSGAPIFCSGNAVVALTLRAEDVQVAPDVQFLTAASGNYVVPNGVYSLTGYMVGGGPGGGGVANANASAGGGTSAVFLQVQMAVTPGQVIPYTCGLFGAGGAAGNNNGATGGDTTFGPFTAKGGLGATGSASGNVAALSATVQSTVITPSKITPTPTQFIASLSFSAGGAGVNGLGGSGGNGNGNNWGVPGAAVGPNAAGLNATGYGAIGSSATSSTGGTFKGGDGAPGAIMIVANPT